MQAQIYFIFEQTSELHNLPARETKTHHPYITHTIPT